MIWFGIGAAAGIVLLVYRVGAFRLLQGGNHPIQGALAAAVMGAAVFGTILWLIFG